MPGELDFNSQVKLKHCHPLLQRGLIATREKFAFMIVTANRDKIAQELAYHTGKSKAKWGESPHDFDPALGADCAPLPLDWENIAAFDAMGAALEVGFASVGIPATWGGRWTMAKEGIVDRPHIQLANWRQIAQGLNH